MGFLAVQLYPSQKSRSQLTRLFSSIQLLISVVIIVPVYFYFEGPLCSIYL